MPYFLTLLSGLSLGDWLGLVGVGVGIVGFIYAIRTNNLNDELQRQLKTVTMNDIQNFAEDIVDRLGRWRPDVIYCPDLRAGFVGYFVTEEMGLNIPILTGYVFSKKKPIPNCNIDQNYEEQETPGYWVLIEKYVYKFQGKKVLIIDEIAVSGEAIFFIKKNLIEKNFSPGNIKSAVIVASVVVDRDHPRRPDYCWRIVEHDPHDISFPWGRWK